jgi:hypothetical protein
MRVPPNKISPIIQERVFDSDLPEEFWLVVAVGRSECFFEESHNDECCETDPLCHEN